MRLFPNMRSKRLARLFAVLTAVVLMLTLFCGCSDEDDVYLGIESMPVNLDPQLSQGEEAELVIRHLFKRLVTVRDGKITASAAESWEVSEDGLRYTFTIRDGECWSDGEPLTAEDYVFAFDRLFDPETDSPYAAEFLSISGALERLEGMETAVGVTAPDEQTVVFTLRQPDNRFLYLLSTEPASPCREDFFLSTHGRYGLTLQTILGNGDYRVTTWNDTELRLRGVAGTVEEGTSVLLTTAEPQQQYAVWQPVEEGGEGLVYGLMLNPERPLFADDRVRRALLSDLPDDCPRRLVPESMWDTGEQLDFPQMNSDEMRQMYLEGAAAAGGSEGLTVLISEESGLYDAFAAVAQIWQRNFGLFLAVELLPERELQQRVADGDYDAALTFLSAKYDHPSGVLMGMLETDQQAGDGTFSERYSQAVAETDEGKASQLYFEAEQALLDEGFFLPLFIRRLELVSGPLGHSDNPGGRAITIYHQ